MSAGVSEQVVVPTGEDMVALGRRLATLLRAGDLVVLDGPLGAGKTTLTRGIAEGLGVVGEVTSPTFVIARQHRAGNPGQGFGLVHVDAYRVDSGDDLDDLEVAEELDSSVLVVEWGLGKVESWPAPRLVVRIARDTTGEVEVRAVTVTADASRWPDLAGLQ